MGGGLYSPIRLVVQCLREASLLFPVEDDHLGELFFRAEGALGLVGDGLDLGEALAVDGEGVGQALELAGDGDGGGSFFGCEGEGDDFVVCGVGAGDF